MAGADIPYWRANVPREQWPTECPEFLLDLSERDRELVGRRDQDYHRLTWPEVKNVIGSTQPVMLGHTDLHSKRRIESTVSCECRPIFGDTWSTISS